MIKVLSVDDHKIVRDGLKQILLETSDIKVVDEAGSGEEAISKVRQKDYDVILLDISLPDTDGLEVLKQIKEEKPKQVVLMLSMYPEEQYAVRALKAGAAGYLTKDSASEELITAIRKIATGGKYVTLSLAEKLAAHLGADAEAAPHETLSDREYQVMRLIGEGKSVGEIAEDLFLSVKTVSTYRARILEKMEMSNNAEIMRYAIKQGIVI